MQEYFKELDTAVYQGKFTITAGGSDAKFQLISSNGTRLLIKSIHVQMSSTSADRDIRITLQNSSNDIISYLGSDLTFGSTSWFSLPSVGTAATNAYNIS